MKRIEAVNDFVIKFANVNGTGSASANNMFAKSLFRMGLPISPKNIFPSNIQGLPTWYEIRVSEKGYLGRRGGVDMMVCMNPQSMAKDIQEVEAGGYFFYDSSKPLDIRLMRSDIHFIGVPLKDLCQREYSDARQQQLFRNIIYVGALSALLDIEFEVLTGLVSDQFRGKEKLITPNVRALEIGYHYAVEHYQCPLGIRVERRDAVGDQILIDGNTAASLGAIYGGATVAAWYPITPSTSVVDGFDKYCKRLRIDPGSGSKNYAIVQAEDELAAIGMVIGASWNGARAFTATSGPGISLMSEFLGLAYFAEIPTVLIDVQRAGPSTGMPTRTQQSDVLACAYASHGDTKHVLLFPATPRECFEMTAQAFDLAETLQTPVIMLTDLDLGMNDNMSPPLVWDDKREYQRGKVFNEAQLEAMSERFGRYLDIDDDGISYRTYPGTHPSKGAFFTRGTSRDEYAVYTEDGDEYEKNMQRLLKKWDTAKNRVPIPELIESAKKSTSKVGVIHFGTSRDATLEAVDALAAEGYAIDTLRIKGFPFHKSVDAFIEAHDTVFVIDQNRDAQMRTLLVNECLVSPRDLISILNYNGTPITARKIRDDIIAVLRSDNVRPLHKKTLAKESV
ncbi:2-oxoglutarate oxidoreductase subunit KorA [Zhongshania aliphaticivorans]|uniref:2-oxoglutarate oxidoreductase subunit KorA n=1 Tax=Zhongshania aliphaticivorans TaxID=1470434 RepID=A0A5S9MTG5_9GAMM|nr:2-oxoacid:acceptor oxidoreductase subunit alpha [Zhongshania aliphaticivorans]CAA0079279.1 2-oxoglutarate oxidoreductase subunit KorA [Zhongshania aliphaticivorans]CAA0086225.1 2-oxoglutarate oxidoreductase subunit KorA [Zhongshania aliphaticivorans]